MGVPRVLYEEPDLLVLEKPAGLLVHGIAEKLKAEPTLTDWLVEHYPEVSRVGDDPATRPGIVHRLDRETSGVMVIARSQVSFSYLKLLFQRRAVEKRYQALVFGDMPLGRGTIDAPIGQKPGTTRHTTRIDRAKLVKDAKTDYTALQHFAFQGIPLTLLSLLPRTGRTHQIRVHLASVHHPVLGDALYGGEPQRKLAEALGLTRHFLHAESLEFTGPRGNRIQVHSELPPDLARALALAEPSPGHRGSQS